MKCDGCKKKPARGRPGVRRCESCVHCEFCGERIAAQRGYRELLCECCVQLRRIPGANSVEFMRSLARQIVLQAARDSERALARTPSLGASAPPAYAEPQRVFVTRIDHSSA